MKAITLNPLWAHLWAHGLKKNETRSWCMRYQGLYLVHSSQKMTDAEKLLCEQEPFKSALLSIGIFHWSELQRGAIIGRVEVIDHCKVIQSESGLRLENKHGLTRAMPGGIEQAFGDYRVDRWIAIGQNHFVFKTPIACKGQQGLWDFSDLQFNQLYSQNL